MSNSDVCNEVVQEIIQDVQAIESNLQARLYTWATMKDIEQLVLARRRIRLAMTKLDIEWRQDE